MLEPSQPPVESPGASPTSWLEAAVLLGRRIAGQAIWHDDRCTWVGASIEEGPSGAALTYATLGPDLYGGTSGVAFFLAELAVVTGEELFRRTAIGAMTHALTREPELPLDANRSLYSGRLGIAVAAATVGAALGRAQFLEKALQIVTATDCQRPRGEFDVVSGRAGAIFGLLWLNAKLGEPRLRNEAQRLAGELVEAAERRGPSGGEASWASGPRMGGGNLTGFSHGASGAACALLETAAVTGQTSLIGVAEQALAYERSLFDPEMRNWPDLRGRAGAPRRRRGPSSYPVAWCHGAAGIGLARLRAYELIRLPVLEREAAIALETTADHTTAMLRAGTGSYSLCHGLAGNAEILDMGSRILGSSGARWREVALAVASAGIERYGSPGKSWPCGTPEGETPGLMLGLAGAGLFYLRLHDPKIGSALLLSLPAGAGRIGAVPSGRSEGALGDGPNAG